MQLASSPAFYEPPLAAKPQLSEKPRQGFETKKTAWKPGPNAPNSTVAIGIRAGLVLEGVRETYRARYYNPTTGRFLSEDPIGFAGSGTNLYAYASNNPISNKDPLGLCSKMAACADEAINTAAKNSLKAATVMMWYSLIMTTILLVSLSAYIALFFPTLFATAVLFGEVFLATLSDEMLQVFLAGVLGDFGYEFAGCMGW
jgi:hypothetical protein